MSQSDTAFGIGFYCGASAIRESAHPPNSAAFVASKSVPGSCEPQRHLPGCRGEMLSTTWQGACVTRCLAVVPNITSPNVRPWW